MGDGTIKQLGEKTAVAQSDDKTLSNLRAAAILEDAWSHRSNPYQTADAHRGLVQAQASPDRPAARIGPQGADGAPVMPPIETVHPAGIAVTGAPRTDTNPAAGIKPPAGYVYNPAASAGIPDTTPSGFKAAKFDPTKSYGEDPVMYWADMGAKGVGFAGAAKLTYDQWKPKVTGSFNFPEPDFNPTSHLSAGVWGDFQHHRGLANTFLESQADAIKSDPAFIAMPDDPARRTRPQKALVSRLETIEQYQGATGPALETGEYPLSRVDFRGLDAKIRREPDFVHVRNLETAQDALITERNANIARIRSRAEATYNAEKTMARWGAIGDTGALVGGELTNLLVDHVTPRNKSGWTTAIDLVVPPLVMVADLSKFGKWGSVAKAGTIVLTHVASHFLTDTKIDENNP